MEVSRIRLALRFVGSGELMVRVNCRKHLHCCLRLGDCEMETYWLMSLA